MVIRYKHCINKAKTMTDGLINMYNVYMPQVDNFATMYSPCDIE